MLAATTTTWSMRGKLGFMETTVCFAWFQRAAIGRIFRFFLFISLLGCVRPEVSCLTSSTLWLSPVWPQMQLEQFRISTCVVAFVCFC